MSARHLRRATEARLGVSPVELAQTGRLALAKQLLQDTQLPITEIAFAAGFGSVRRFNALFTERMGSAPRRFVARSARRAPGDIVLRLDYRAPYDWARLLAFLAARAIPGVETVGDDYRRIVHLNGATGRIAVRHANGRLALAISPSLVAVVMPLVVRVRRLFDLDAHPNVIAGVLGSDPLLGPHVAARPGLRVPGAIDPFEAAIRAMLGQQVSVAAATTLAGRFAAKFGAPFEDGVRFPTAAEVARASIDAIASDRHAGGARGRAARRSPPRSRAGALRFDAPRSRCVRRRGGRAARHRPVDGALPRDARAARARRISRRRSRRHEGARARRVSATEARVAARGDRSARTPCCTSGTH